MPLFVVCVSHVSSGVEQCCSVPFPSLRCFFQSCKTNGPVHDAPFKLYCPQPCVPPQKLKMSLKLKIVVPFSWLLRHHLRQLQSCVSDKSRNPSPNRNECVSRLVHSLSRGPC